MSEQSAVAGGSTGNGLIVARAGSYYRNARYLVCGMIFVFGLWFCYDGFVRYPEYNQKFDRMTPTERLDQHMETKKSPLDLLIQRVIGVSLPPLSILMLVFFLYRSRGEYRLQARTLHIPGHPPITLDRITELDRSLWDRKGILIVHYTRPEGDTPAKAKLDDFVYERAGTDAIVASLTQQLFPAEAPQGEAPAV